MEPVPRKRQPDFVSSAGIQEPEQHPLAFAHAQWLSGAEHLRVQSGGLVGNFPTVIGRAHVGQRWLPMVRRDAEFLIVIAGVPNRLDDSKTILAGEAGAG